MGKSDKLLVDCCPASGLRRNLEAYIEISGMLSQCLLKRQLIKVKTLPAAMKTPMASTVKPPMAAQKRYLTIQLFTCGFLRQISDILRRKGR